MHKFNIDPMSEFNICELYANDKLIAVNTLSGRGIFLTDYKEKGFILDRLANPIDIAESILICLKHHRKVNRKEDTELYNSNNLKQLRKQWIQDLMLFGQYKDEASIFKPLYRITFIEQAGFIKTEPSKQTSINSWTGDGITDEMSIYCKSNAKEIGEIFELALSKCKSKY